MDYAEYKELKVALYELLTSTELLGLKDVAEDSYNKIIRMFESIKAGSIFSEYFSSEDFSSSFLSEEEYLRMSNTQKAEIMKELHAKISQVYILLAHYVNRDAHKKNSRNLFELKHVYMENYIANAILGNKHTLIVHDKDDRDYYLLQTHMKLIDNNKEKSIELHFGTKQHYIQNYNTIMEGALRELKKYEPSNIAEKKNYYKVILKDFITNLETHPIEEKAHFRPFTRFLSEFSYDTGIISEAFSEVCDHDLDKDKEAFLAKLSNNIEDLQHSKKGTSVERNKAIARLIENCQLTQPRGKTAFDSKELTKVLEGIGYDVTEEELAYLINKKDNLHSKKSDRILLKKYKQQKNNPKELLGILTSTVRENTDQIFTLADIDFFYGDNPQFSNLLNVINEITLANGEEKNKLKKKLIYRCVGMGTEGENALFLDDSDKSSYDQISDFIRGLNLSIPDLDEQISDAFEYKELLKEEGWNIGSKPISQYGFVEILKNGMIDHNMDLENVNQAIDCYRRLDMLYGRDDDGTIEIIAKKINKIFKEDERRSNR